jgi:L-alanine-DL-glutamate epimerase-like enolase superfamily enzyme
MAEALRIQEIAVTHQPVNHRDDWVFLALTDAGGRVGFGEASHSGDAEQRRAVAAWRGSITAEEAW